MNSRISSTDWLAAISSSLRRRVDAVVAAVHRRRRGDPDVDLLRAGLAQHAHDLARRRAADDRVVDEHDALALHDLAHGVELDLDAEVADRLLRLDERPADVVIADEAEGEGDARLLGVTESRDTCPSPARARRRRPAPGAPARGAVRTPAATRRRCGRRPWSRAARSRRARRRTGVETGKAKRCEVKPSRDRRHDLAGLDVPLVLGADQVERAGLGGDDGRALADAQRQRPDPVAGRARRRCPSRDRITSE